MLRLRGEKTKGDLPGADTASKVSAAPLFFMREVSLVGAEIGFSDFASDPQVRTKIKDIDFKISGLSLNRPFSLSGDLSFFSKEKNISFSSSAAIDLKDAKVSFSNANLKTDLAQWDMDELSSVFPALKEQNEATLIGISSDGYETIQLNPSLEIIIQPGGTLYYIAEKRIKSIEWEGLGV